MAARKTLRELTIKNNFMFGDVMCDEENCKEFLEMVLQIPIEHVEVSKEKSIVYHPEYKGIRLDVIAKDEHYTHYDVEMQAIPKAALGKRARYYHSQIDMELLLSGEEYVNLPNSYVIFICDFDPFEKKKYRYTFANQCLEDQELNQQDGSFSIFLSTRGENEKEVPEGMVKFLKFVRADLTESEKDFEDAYVKKLQESVRHVKESREMEERFMLFQEMLREERTEGRAEGKVEGKVEGKAEAVIELLEELEPISDEVREKIMTEKSLETLGKWLKLAAKAESMEEFLKEM